MIKVTIERKNEKVKKVRISGHAEYEEMGKDIVCASVSSIAITTVNAILRLDENAIQYKEEEGLLELSIQSEDPTISLLITNMLELLQELETQYKRYIKIIK